MLKPTNYNDGDIIAIDRAYIDYSKFEELTNRGVIYVTKMKKNLVYEVLSKRHQDTNLGYTNSQPSSDGHTKTHQTPLELLRIGYNGEDHAHVLRELLYFS